MSLTEGILLESETTECSKKVEKKAGKRIGFNYIILNSLKKSDKNDVVRCFYIKNITDFGWCVIKEGSSGGVKDASGRGIRDRLIWQERLHKTLSDKLLIPKYIGSFQESGNSYLAIEYIRGTSLYSYWKTQYKSLRASLISGTSHSIRFLTLYRKALISLKNLHLHKVVHRDATLMNFMVNWKSQVFIIDLELSYSIEEESPSPPFALGTFGYMSPEQIKITKPTEKEDIYSAGAILFQLWAGISPNKLIEESIDIQNERIDFFVNDYLINHTIKALLSKEPHLRPSLDDLIKIIDNLIHDIKNGKKRKVAENNKRGYVIDENLIYQCVNSLASPLMLESNKGWFSNNMNMEKDGSGNKFERAYYASLNRGASGVIYVLSVAKKLGYDVSSCYVGVNKGLENISERYINDGEKKNVGLHFGSDGIAMMLSLSIANGLLADSTEMRSWIKKLFLRRSDKLNIIEGIAGQGVGLIVSAGLLDQPFLMEKLTLYSNELKEKQRKNGSWKHENMKDKPAYGFGYGVAGICTFLLNYGAVWSDQDAMEVGTKGLNWLIKESVTKNGRINWKNSKNKDLTFSWVDGVSGIAHAFLQAYKIVGNKAYLDIALRSLESIDSDIISSNIGLYQGLTGLGEVYIDAFSITNDEKWLEKARWITSFIIALKRLDVRTNQSYWLVEGERHPVGNFMIGNSGILHYLLKYSNAINNTVSILPYI